MINESYIEALVLRVDAARASGDEELVKSIGDEIVRAKDGTHREIVGQCHPGRETKEDSGEVKP